MKNHTRAFTLCLLFAFPTTVQGGVCEDAIRHAEAVYKIPPLLLMAIGKTEAALEDEIHPWTINVEGDGYFYETKEDALHEINRFLSEGKTIDVGCLQVNHRWHNKNFKYFEMAINPKRNALYAAKLLHGLQQRYKSWRSAVGFYHSGKVKYQRPYIEKVYRTWDALKERDQAVRKGQ